MENETPKVEPPSKMPPVCPSAQPQMEGATLLGVVSGTPEKPRLAYLAAPLPVTAEMLALTGPISPTAVLRFGAPCAGRGCRHFDGADCRLAARIVQLLPPVVDGLPACHLRPDCRWWQQEGRAACLRCPQVVTELRDPSELHRQVADPEAPSAPPTPALPVRSLA
jgi:hypothetical protein